MHARARGARPSARRGRCSARLLPTYPGAVLVYAQIARSGDHDLIVRPVGRAHAGARLGALDREQRAGAQLERALDAALLLLLLILLLLLVVVMVVLLLLALAGGARRCGRVQGAQRGRWARRRVCARGRGQHGALC